MIRDEVAKSLYGSVSELNKIELFINELDADGEFDLSFVSAPEFRHWELTNYIVEKVDSCAYFDRMCDSEITMIELRIDELKVLKDKIEYKRKRFGDYLLKCLDVLGMDLHGKQWKISFRKPLKQVKINDENQVPIQYLKQEIVVKIDKAAIKRDILNGVLVDGCELVDGKRSVTFKEGKV